MANNIFLKNKNTAFDCEKTVIEDLVKKIEVFESLRSNDEADDLRVLDLKRKLVALRFNGKITPPAEAGKRWSTHIKSGAKSTVGGKDVRISVKGQSEEDLLNNLIEKLYPEFCKSGKTIRSIFDEWNHMEYRHVAENTITRDSQLYKKYLEGSTLENMDISDISEAFLRNECMKLIEQKELTRKAWNNMKSILNGVYEYAKEKEICTDNISANVNFGKRYEHIFKQALKKAPEEEIYSKKERDELFVAIDKEYALKGDNALLGIKLAFYTGLRAGELVALKWDDVFYDSEQIRVVRGEVRKQKKKITTVEDHTKDHEVRFVYLLPEAKEILDQIPKDGDYILTREGKRITERQFTYALEKMTAKKMGITYRSPHKIRKSTASYLGAESVSIKYLQEQLGHSNLSTTSCYLFNTEDEAENRKKMRSALSVKDSER